MEMFKCIMICTLDGIVWNKYNEFEDFFMSQRYGYNMISHEKAR